MFGMSCRVGGYLVGKICLRNDTEGEPASKRKMGALTSKVLTFKMRPWEVSSLRTIALGEKFFFPINVDIVGKKIKRILPAIVNEEWVDNMFRFVRTEKIGKNGIINFFLNVKILIYFFSFNYRTMYQKEFV